MPCRREGEVKCLLKLQPIYKQNWKVKLKGEIVWKAPYYNVHISTSLTWLTQRQKKVKRPGLTFL